MIKFTIRTLDSRDHPFTVDDEITVQELKQKVMEEMGLDIGLQLLIFCGRVLKDDKKLAEYGVEGKVIHMAQKVPPSVEAREALLETERERDMENAFTNSPNNIPPQLIAIQGVDFEDLPGLELSPTASRLELLRRLITEMANQIEALKRNESDIEPPSGSTRQSRGQSNQLPPERAMGSPYHTPPADFGEIVEQLHNLDVEFAPFRELYVRTLRQVNNPQIQLEEEELQRRQRNAEYSAELYHSFSHAYHIVSDIGLLMTHENSRLTSEEFPVETHINVIQSSTTRRAPNEASSSNREEPPLNITVRPEPIRYQVEMEAGLLIPVNPDEEEPPRPQAVSVVNLMHDRFLPCDSQHARRQLQRRREDTFRAGGPRLRDSSRGRGQNNVVVLFDSFDWDTNNEETLMIAVFLTLREATASSSRTLVPGELFPLRRRFRHHMREIMQGDYVVGTQDQLAELIFARHAVFIARIQLITPIRQGVDLVESMKAVVVRFLNEAMTVLEMEDNEMFSRRYRIVYPRIFFELCGVLSYCCLEGIEGLTRIYISFISDLIQNIEEPARDLLYSLAMENLNTAISRIETNKVHSAQFIRREGGSQDDSSVSQSEAMQRSLDDIEEFNPYPSESLPVGVVHPITNLVNGTLRAPPNTPTTIPIVRTVTTVPNVSTSQIPTRTHSVPIVPTAPITPTVSMVSSTPVPIVPTIMVRPPTPVLPTVPTSPTIPSTPTPSLHSPEYMERSGAFAIASDSNQVQSSAAAYPRERPSTPKSTEKQPSDNE